jgi:hypothetical protein
MEKSNTWKQCDCKSCLKDSDQLVIWSRDIDGQCDKYFGISDDGDQDAVSGFVHNINGKEEICTIFIYRTGYPNNVGGWPTLDTIRSSNNWNLLSDDVKELIESWRSTV